MNEATKANNDSFSVQASLATAWNDGFDFARRACGWWSADKNPPTAGLYAVRDSKGNIEIAFWYCDHNGEHGEWTRELRDVDPIDIQAWMQIPDGPTAGMEKAHAE